MRGDILIMYLITKLLILEHYIFYIIGLILAIYFIIKILKYIIKKENIFTDKKAAEFAKEWMKKYPLRYNIAIIIIMSLWIFFVIYVGIIMYLKELPNIIKNKYEIEECIVENQIDWKNNLYIVKMIMVILYILVITGNLYLKD